MAGAVQRAEGEERVTALELFFDLVFVLAITQVTSLMSHDPTWAGVGRGMLVLAALWWTWVGYAWLTNAVNPEEGGVRLLFFVAMAAMLIVALAVPHAFADDAEVFGVSYLIVRGMLVGLYVLATRGDAQQRTALRSLAPPILIGAALVTAGCFAGGTAQYVFWGVALVIDYLGPLAGDPGNWRVHPHHFAERHGLIIIIALGESIVAIGVAASEDISTGMIVASALGTAIVCALWWAYFDVVALVAERRLAARTGADRSATARDSYSYLHLPMVAGIVLFALGMKKTLTHVDAPLPDVAAFALCGGLALYLLGHIAFRLRNVGTLNKQRCLTVVALLALIPLAQEVDALLALAFVTIVSCGLIAYEAIRFREVRNRVRHAEEVLVSS